jgi:hypothetical protein
VDVNSHWSNHVLVHHLARARGGLYAVNSAIFFSRSLPLAAIPRDLRWVVRLVPSIQEGCLIPAAVIQVLPTCHGNKTIVNSSEPGPWSGPVQVVVLLERELSLDRVL